MWPPIGAHWGNLAYTIELVLPSAHPSPQPKQQINWFSRICTAHGRMSSGILWHVLSPNSYPLRMGDLGSIQYMLTWVHRAHNLNGIPIGSAIFA